MRHAVARGELQRRAQARWSGVRQWSPETMHRQKSESDCPCDQGFATHRRSAYQYACANLANSALPDIRLLTAMTASLQSSLHSVQPQRLRNLTPTFTIDVRVCFYTHFMVYGYAEFCAP